MRNPIDTRSPWVFHWAMLVTFLTFPLIWLGGLVTTQDAGMAVPDWPGTFGYNLFLYPMSAWIYGPFDLFVEHGHRLLASIVGLFAIGLCVVAYRTESRRWLVGTCFFFLSAIIAQGVLGGVRVLFDARTLAMIHGCSGPLVFALGSFIAMASSTRWHNSKRRLVGNGLGRLAVLLLVLSVSQLFVGAHLRQLQAVKLHRQRVGQRVAVAGKGPHDSRVGDAGHVRDGPSHGEAQSVERRDQRPAHGLCAIGHGEGQRRLGREIRGEEGAVDRGGNPGGRDERTCEHKQVARFHENYPNLTKLQTNCGQLRTMAGEIEVRRQGRALRRAGFNPHHAALPRRVRVESLDRLISPAADRKCAARSRVALNPEL